MLTSGQAQSPLAMIRNNSPIRTLAFSANGEYLVSGDEEGIGVWEVESGRRTTRMAVQTDNCLAVSKDGNWISAGTEWGLVYVWNARTYQLIFSHQEDSDINGVDFSPTDSESSRLLVASRNCTATIWDAVTQQRTVGPLHHETAVRAAKYSPQGDRIATATRNSVWVYNSDDGHLLADIPVEVTPWYHTTLLWSSQRLFVVSNQQIKKIDASTGSVVSEWPVFDTNYSSCIALPQHREFIAYSTNSTITFWDTSTHTQLGVIKSTHKIRSIAFSPDSRCLAVGESNGEITFKQLSSIIVSITNCNVCHWISGTNLLFIAFLRSLQSLCLIYTPLSGNQIFILAILLLVCGRTINSPMRRHH